MAEYFVTQGYSLAEERGYIRVEPPLDSEDIATFEWMKTRNAEVDSIVPRTESTDLHFAAPTTEAAIALSVMVKRTLEEQGHSVLQAEGLRRLAPYQLYIRGS
jgi:hypothetical protein